MWFNVRVKFSWHYLITALRRKQLIRFKVTVFLCGNEKIETEKKKLFTNKHCLLHAVQRLFWMLIKPLKEEKTKKQKYENNNTKWLLFESPQQIVWLNFVNLCTICKYVCSAHILKHCKFVDAGQKICRIAYLIFCFFILGT